MVNSEAVCYHSPAEAVEVKDEVLEAIPLSIEDTFTTQKSCFM